MNRRRNFVWREILLLLVPTLALVAWGGLQSRGPFKLVVDEIKIKPHDTIHPAKGTLPAYREVQVIVFIGYEGPGPSWWGVGANLDNPRVLFTTKSEKDDGSSVGSYANMNFDESRGQYTFIYRGNIPANPNYLKESTCHISAGLETRRVPVKKLATAKISFPAGQFEYRR
ncbi:MAG: hypothetical protein EOP04_05985 [Proteobacteria bacterium]|nr:MAG: hypothetical protein EOP04_05985 [Pseudomonadota bacterium]